MRLVVTATALMSMQIGCIEGMTEEGDASLQPRVLEAMLGQFEDRSDPRSVIRSIVWRTCESDAIEGTLERSDAWQPERIHPATRAKCPAAWGPAGEVLESVVLSHAEYTGGMRGPSGNHGNWQGCSNYGGDTRGCSPHSSFRKEEPAQVRHTPWRGPDQPETIAFARDIENAPACAGRMDVPLIRVADSLDHLYCVADTATAQGLTRVVRGIDIDSLVSRAHCARPLMNYYAPGSSCLVPDQPCDCRSGSGRSMDEDAFGEESEGEFSEEDGAWDDGWDDSSGGDDDGWGDEWDDGYSPGDDEEPWD